MYYKSLIKEYIGKPTFKGKSSINYGSLVHHYIEL